MRNNELVSQRPGRPSAWWSKRRLSLGRIRGLSGRLVQNASESARNRLDLAKTAKLRRILDHPRADPSERGVTQTHFGPQPTPGSADTNRSSSSRRNATQHHRRAPWSAPPTGACGATPHNTTGEDRSVRNTDPNVRPHDLRSRPVAWCSGCAVPSGGRLCGECGCGALLGPALPPRPYPHAARTAPGGQSACHGIGRPTERLRAIMRPTEERVHPGGV